MYLDSNDFFRVTYPTLCVCVCVCVCVRHYPILNSDDIETLHDTDLFVLRELPAQG